MATYTCNEFNPWPREIHLGTLLSGFFDELVACGISAVSLDDNPWYEPLSYEWGAPVFKKP